MLIICVNIGQNKYSPVTHNNLTCNFAACSLLLVYSSQVHDKEIKKNINKC